MSPWEDELRLDVEIPVERNDLGETVKAAVIAAIEKKLEDVPTDVFDHLGVDKNLIVFRTVRQGPGPSPLRPKEE